MLGNGGLPKSLSLLVSAVTTGDPHAVCHAKAPQSARGRSLAGGKGLVLPGSQFPHLYNGSVGWKILTNVRYS